MIDLEKTKNDLIDQLRETIIRLQNTGIQSSIKTNDISAAEVKDENFVQQFAAKLPKAGSHIYWLTVDNSEQLLEQFKKKSIDSTYKVARDNKNAESKCVYVGSCTRIKLGDRFKQHCGYGHHSTYSLQLSKWIDDTDLLFTFSYVEVEDDLLVQYIDDQWHRALKPLFGKPGGNNKVRITQ